MSDERQQSIPRTWASGMRNAEIRALPPHPLAVPPGRCPVCRSELGESGFCKRGAACRDSYEQRPR